MAVPPCPKPGLRSEFEASEAGQEIEHIVATLLARCASLGDGAVCKSSQWSVQAV